MTLRVFSNPGDKQYMIVLFYVHIYHDLHTSILSMTYTHPWLHMIRATFFHEGYVKTVRHISVAACQSRSKPRAL